MAMTIQEAVIIAVGTSIPAGGTEAAPNAAGVGTSVGPFADYADTFQYRITNGGSAPGAPVVLVFQASSGNGRWYEVARVSGDTVANSTYSNPVPVPPGAAYFRALAFGNTTNAVTVEVILARQVP